MNENMTATLTFVFLFCAPWYMMIFYFANEAQGYKNTRNACFSSTVQYRVEVLKCSMNRDIDSCKTDLFEIYCGGY